MHRLHFTVYEMAELDRTFCTLSSLGSIITRTCNLETDKLDYASLADMGRLVSEKAGVLLEAIQGPVNVALLEKPVDENAARAN